MLTASIGPIPVAFIVIVVGRRSPTLAPCFRIGSGAEGRRVRRPVGQTRRGQDQLAPGPGPRPVGVLAAVAAFFVMARSPIGNAPIGDTFALNSITAAVLGGAALAGGRATFLGEHGGRAPARAHHHRPALPRSVTRRWAADHRRPGAARDRPVPARRPEGARQAELQARPAPGHEEPATQDRRAPGLLPEGPGLPCGAFGQDADPRRDGAQHGPARRGPPIRRRADRRGHRSWRSARTCPTARSR